MQDIEKAVMVTRVCSKNWWNTDKKPLLVCLQKDVDKERQRNRKGYSKAFCATSKRKKSWLLFVLPEIENTYWQHAVFDLEHFHKNIWLALLEIIYSALQNSDEKKQNTFLIKTRFQRMVNNTKTNNTFSNYTWSLFLKKENSFIQIREFIYKQKKQKTNKQKNRNLEINQLLFPPFDYFNIFEIFEMFNEFPKRKKENTINRKIKITSIKRKEYLR